jgi:hypothetical protein
MSHFHGLIDFVGSHPLFAFVAVLLLALSEAVPVIGTVVPGSTLIIAISALATTADVKPWLLLLAAVVGAIAGDGLSFWLGYRPHASKVILFILGVLILGSIAWHLLKGQSQVRLGASASGQGSEVATSEI